MAKDSILVTLKTSFAFKLLGEYLINILSSPIKFRKYVYSGLPIALINFYVLVFQLLMALPWMS